MKAFARPVVALAFAASSPAIAQVDYDSLKPSATPAIAAAALQCQAATGPARVDEARLISNGWAREVATGKRGIREKSRHELIRGQIILWLTQKESSCIVLARLRDAAQYDEVIEALAASLGQPSRRQPDGSVLWLQESGAGLEASRTGNAKKPSLRLFILPATK